MANIYLVACAKKKRSESAPAECLYDSDLFRKSRALARLRADHWYILSAKYGLLHPDQVIQPYDKTLKKMRKSERDAWAMNVVQELTKVAAAGSAFTVLAGKEYRETLVPELRKVGYCVEVPMKGLRFGQQLQWLKHKLQEAKHDCEQ